MAMEINLNAGRSYLPRACAAHHLIRETPKATFLLAAMANNDSTPKANLLGRCLSETSSRCLTASVTATHNFEVANFSMIDGMSVGKYVSSSTFSAGGRDWNIRFFPDGSSKEDKGAYVSAFLRLVRGESVRTKFSLSLSGGDGSVLSKEATTHTFCSVSDWGFIRFLERTKLQSLLRGSNNDCLTIKCVLTVVEQSRSEDVVSAILVPEPNLHQDLACILKDGEGADATFGVSGQLFHAHRCVRAGRTVSSLQAELFGPMKKEPAQRIEIDDMEPSVFEALLHFMYTDSLPDNSSADNKNATMQYLLVAADRYGLDRLRLICEAALCSGIDVKSVATTLALAEQHHCLQLKDACLRFVASRDALGAIVGTDGFKHLSESCPSVVKEILEKVAANRTG